LEGTQWVQVAVFKPVLDDLPEELIKGEQVYIEGKLKVNRSENAEGQRANLTVTAARVLPLNRIGRLGLSKTGAIMEPLVKRAGCSGRLKERCRARQWLVSPRLLPVGTAGIAANAEMPTAGRPIQASKLSVLGAGGLPQGRCAKLMSFVAPFLGGTDEGLAIREQSFSANCPPSGGLCAFGLVARPIKRRRPEDSQR